MPPKKSKLPKKTTGNKKAVKKQINTGKNIENSNINNEKSQNQSSEENDQDQEYNIVNEIDNMNLEQIAIEKKKYQDKQKSKDTQINNSITQEQQQQLQNEKTRQNQEELQQKQKKNKQLKKKKQGQKQKNEDQKSDEENQDIQDIQNKDDNNSQIKQEDQQNENEEKQNKKKKKQNLQESDSEDSQKDHKENNILKDKELRQSIKQKSRVQGLQSISKASSIFLKNQSILNKNKSSVKKSTQKSIQKSDFDINSMSKKGFNTKLMLKQQEKQKLIDRQILRDQKELEFLAYYIGVNENEKKQHFIQQLLEQFIDETLPYGWEKEFDPENNVIYYNQDEYFITNQHPKIKEFRLAYYNELEKLNIQKFQEQIVEFGEEKKEDINNTSRPSLKKFVLNFSQKLTGKNQQNTQQDLLQQFTGQNKKKQLSKQSVQKSKIQKSIMGGLKAIQSKDLFNDKQDQQVIKATSTEYTGANYNLLPEDQKQTKERFDMFMDIIQKQHLDTYMDQETVKGKNIKNKDQVSNSYNQKIKQYGNNKLIQMLKNNKNEDQLIGNDNNTNNLKFYAVERKKSNNIFVSMSEYHEIQNKYKNYYIDLYTEMPAQAKKLISQLDSYKISDPNLVVEAILKLKIQNSQFFWLGRVYQSINLPPGWQLQQMEMNNQIIDVYIDFSVPEQYALNVHPCYEYVKLLENKQRELDQILSSSDQDSDEQKQSTESSNSESDGQESQIRKNKRASQKIRIQQLNKKNIMVFQDILQRKFKIDIGRLVAAKQNIQEIDNGINDVSIQQGSSSMYSTRTSLSQLNLKKKAKKIKNASETAEDNIVLKRLQKFNNKYLEDLNYEQEKLYQEEFLEEQNRKKKKRHQRVPSNICDQHILAIAEQAQVQLPQESHILGVITTYVLWNQEQEDQLWKFRQYKDGRYFWYNQKQDEYVKQYPYLDDVLRIINLYKQVIDIERRSSKIKFKKNYMEMLMGNLKVKQFKDQKTILKDLRNDAQYFISQFLKNNNRKSIIGVLVNLYPKKINPIIEQKIALKKKKKAMQLLLKKQIKNKQLGDSQTTSASIKNKKDVSSTESFSNSSDDDMDKETKLQLKLKEYEKIFQQNTTIQGSCNLQHINKYFRQQNKLQDEYLKNNILFNQPFKMTSKLVSYEEQKNKPQTNFGKILAGQQLAGRKASIMNFQTEKPNFPMSSDILRNPKFFIGDYNVDEYVFVSSDHEDEGDSEESQEQNNIFKEDDENQSQLLSQSLLLSLSDISSIENSSDYINSNDSFNEKLQKRNEIHMKNISKIRKSKGMTEDEAKEFLYDKDGLKKKLKTHIKKKTPGKSVFDQKKKVLNNFLKGNQQKGQLNQKKNTGLIKDLQVQVNQQNSNQQLNYGKDKNNQDNNQLQLQEQEEQEQEQKNNCLEKQLSIENQVICLQLPQKSNNSIKIDEEDSKQEDEQQQQLQLQEEQEQQEEQEDEENEDDDQYQILQDDKQAVERISQIINERKQTIMQSQEQNKRYSNQLKQMRQSILQEYQKKNQNQQNQQIYKINSNSCINNNNIDQNQMQNQDSQNQKQQLNLLEVQKDFQTSQQKIQQNNIFQKIFINKKDKDTGPARLKNIFGIKDGIEGLKFDQKVIKEVKENLKQEQKKTEQKLKKKNKILLKQFFTSYNAEIAQEKKKEKQLKKQQQQEQFLQKMQELEKKEQQEQQKNQKQQQQLQQRSDSQQVKESKADQNQTFTDSDQSENEEKIAEIQQEDNSIKDNKKIAKLSIDQTVEASTAFQSPNKIPDIQLIDEDEKQDIMEEQEIKDSINKQIVQIKQNMLESQKNDVVKQKKIKEFFLSITDKNEQIQALTQDLITINKGITKQSDIDKNLKAKNIFSKTWEKKKETNKDKPEVLYPGRESIVNIFSNLLKPAISNFFIKDNQDFIDEQNQGEDNQKKNDLQQQQQNSRFSISQFDYTQLDKIQLEEKILKNSKDQNGQNLQDEQSKQNTEQDISIQVNNQNLTNDDKQSNNTSALQLKINTTQTQEQTQIIDPKQDELVLKVLQAQSAPSKLKFFQKIQGEGQKTFSNLKNLLKIEENSPVSDSKFKINSQKKPFSLFSNKVQNQSNNQQEKLQLNDQQNQQLNTSSSVNKDSDNSKLAKQNGSNIFNFKQDSSVAIKSFDQIFDQEDNQRIEKLKLQKEQKEFLIEQQQMAEKISQKIQQQKQKVAVQIKSSISKMLAVLIQQDIKKQEQIQHQQSKQRKSLNLSPNESVQLGARNFQTKKTNTQILNKQVEYQLEKKQNELMKKYQVPKQLVINEKNDESDGYSFSDEDYSNSESDQSIKKVKSKSKIKLNIQKEQKDKETLSFREQLDQQLQMNQSALKSLIYQNQDEIKKQLQQNLDIQQLQFEEELNSIEILKQKLQFKKQVQSKNQQDIKQLLKEKSQSLQQQKIIIENNSKLLQYKYQDQSGTYQKQNSQILIQKFQFLNKNNDINNQKSPKNNQLNPILQEINQEKIQDAQENQSQDAISPIRDNNKKEIIQNIKIYEKGNLIGNQLLKDLPKKNNQQDILNQNFKEFLSKKNKLQVQQKLQIDKKQKNLQLNKENSQIVSKNNMSNSEIFQNNENNQNLQNVKKNIYNNMDSNCDLPKIQSLSTKFNSNTVETRFRSTTLTNMPSYPYRQKYQSPPSNFYNTDKLFNSSNSRADSNSITPLHAINQQQQQKLNNQRPKKQFQRSNSPIINKNKQLPPLDTKNQSFQSEVSINFNELVKNKKIQVKTFKLNENLIVSNKNMQNGYNNQNSQINQNLQDQYNQLVFTDIEKINNVNKFHDQFSKYRIETVLSNLSKKIPYLKFDIQDEKNEIILEQQKNNLNDQLTQGTVFFQQRAIEELERIKNKTIKKTLDNLLVQFIISKVITQEKDRKVLFQSEELKSKFYRSQRYQISNIRTFLLLKSSQDQELQEFIHKLVLEGPNAVNYNLDTNNTQKINIIELSIDKKDKESIDEEEQEDSEQDSQQQAQNKEKEKQQDNTKVNQEKLNQQQLDLFKDNPGKIKFEKVILKQFKNYFSRLSKQQDLIGNILKENTDKNSVLQKYLADKKEDQEFQEFKYIDDQNDINPFEQSFNMLTIPMFVQNLYDEKMIYNLNEDSQDELNQSQSFNEYRQILNNVIENTESDPKVAYKSKNQKMGFKFRDKTQYNTNTILNKQNFQNDSIEVIFLYKQLIELTEEWYNLKFQYSIVRAIKKELGDLHMVNRKTNLNFEIYLDLGLNPQHVYQMCDKLKIKMDTESDLVWISYLYCLFLIKFTPENSLDIVENLLQPVNNNKIHKKYSKVGYDLYFQNILQFHRIKRQFLFLVPSFTQKQKNEYLELNGYFKFFDFDKNNYYLYNFKTGKSVDTQLPYITQFKIQKLNTLEYVNFIEILDGMSALIQNKEKLNFQQKEELRQKQKLINQQERLDLEQRENEEILQNQLINIDNLQIITNNNSNNNNQETNNKQNNNQQTQKQEDQDSQK